MTEMRERTSEVWEGIRRGTGWAMGVGFVVSVAATLRQGPREVLKAAIKAGLRGQEAAAELTEQVGDLYAEARAERGGRSSEAADL